MDSDKTGVAVDIIGGMAKALMTGRQKRVYTKNEKAFYSMLLSYGGPMLHKFVSLNLLGASIDTSRRVLRNKPKLHFNSFDSNIKAVVDIMKMYNCLDMPFLLGEDGTAIKKCLEVTADKEFFEAEKVIVYGLSGGPVHVGTCADLIKKFDELGFATTLYVWELIPIMHRAPHIPLMIATHANDFTADDVLKTWKALWRICHEHGIKLLGHVSDGDSKLRAVDFALQHHPLDGGGGGGGGAAAAAAAAGDGTAAADSGVQRFGIGHPMIQLTAPIVNKRPILCMQDWLHAAWRIRVIYLNTTRSLMIGPLFTSPSNIRRHMRAHDTNLGLKYSDLDERDKQNFNACLRLAGFKLDGTMLPSGNAVYEQLNPDDWSSGDILYLRFFHRFLRPFVSPPTSPYCSPVSVIKDMAYCIAFLGYWRQLCKESTESTTKKHFLTWQTYSDVLHICMNMILSVKLYRVHYPKAPYLPRRCSSRYTPPHTLLFLTPLYCTSHFIVPICVAFASLSYLFLQQV